MTRWFGLVTLQSLLLTCHAAYEAFHQLGLHHELNVVNLCLPLRLLLCLGFAGPLRGPLVAGLDTFANAPAEVGLRTFVVFFDSVVGTGATSLRTTGDF